MVHRLPGAPTLIFGAWPLVLLGKWHVSRDGERLTVCGRRYEPFRRRAAGAVASVEPMCRMCRAFVARVVEPVTVVRCSGVAELPRVGQLPAELVGPLRLAVS